MMATEATVEKPVDVSVTDSTIAQPAIANLDSQHVDPPARLLNGTIDGVDNKQTADTVDELVNSAAASVSGGSDTETFKADPSKLSSDKGHVHSSSTVKKPQSFKSVSVNRTFLASKSATGSTSRPESSAGAVSATPQPIPTSSASRLKLVAKSGSSLGGSTKTLTTNGSSSSAPDASKVWNRNRAPPQPEPKKFSDEELMNKYGIHMADRLGPEDTKGQSNWADDDDDAEWAPDTITWTDGTKITLPLADEAATIPTMTATPPPTKEAIVAPKPKSPAPVTSATGSPSIKPGVLASGKGLVLKGAPEKPTLVAKAPAPPTPVKSPWAQLPPVDRVSPVVMDLPAPSAAPTRFPPRDASNAKSITPPPPAKEIAADDFSRGWRDGNNKELYNSQSGRYEPVPERRGARNEPHGRQPALLQRPQSDLQGPAEPSAAFQTSRTSGGQEGSYGGGRRRGSSNVSGGSGRFVHPYGKPHEIMPPTDLTQISARRGSHTAGAESPVSSTRTFSPANTHPSSRMPPSQPYQNRPYASPVHPPNVMPVMATPDAPQESIEEQQARIMREKREQREAIIRRRVAEEERERAEKQARIDAKLKSMGFSTERTSKREDKSEGATVSHVQTATRKDIPASLATKDRSPTTARVVEAVSKPEIPAEKPSAPMSSTQPIAAAEKTRTDMSKANGEKERLATKHGLARETTTRADHEPQLRPNDLTSESWPDSPQRPDQYPSWSGNRPQQPSGSLWAPPGNNRALGNGTFNAGMSLPDSNTRAPRRPEPIGPPKRAAYQQHGAIRQPPIGPPRNRSEETKKGVAKWGNFNCQDDDARLRAERVKMREEHGDAPAPEFTDTWRSVEIGESGERAAAGLSMKTHAEDVVGGGEMGHSAQKPNRQPLQDGVRDLSARQGSVGSSVPGTAMQARGGSRFFPTSRDTQSQEAVSLSESRTRSPTPPPPTADGHPAYDGDATKPHVALPPQKPRVRLPPPAPQAPTIEPVAAPTKSAPISFAAAAAGAIPPSRSHGQDAGGRPVSRNVGHGGVPQSAHAIAVQQTWQHKINSLIKMVPSARFLPVDSASKAVLEQAGSYDPATVSLPVPSPSFSASTDDASFTSKEMAEMCFGEQEMGSLPIVSIPAMAPEAAWTPATLNWSPTHPKSRVNPTAAEAIEFPLEMPNGKSVIRVTIPGNPESRTVLANLNGHRTASNPRRNGPRAGGGSRRGPARGSGSGRGGRVDTAADHVGDRPSSSSGRFPSTRGGRGSGSGSGYRSRTESSWHHNRVTSAASAGQA
ncbi:hypothetical protein F4778DRAFT_616860 [Xylariomycetidae sp. FL2044]|nr:hypothetical protein F4778DRAFT_616860 [Xylariomycetidae sp. FL2044]